MSEEFEPRAAAKGTTVTVVVGNEERELKATKRKGGWAITPTDAAEAAALAQFGDEALDPPPAAEADDQEDQTDGSGEGEKNEPDEPEAPAPAEAGDGQEETE